MREFDLEELARFNGQDGSPVYVVHQGKVYDVTGSRLWKNGLHMRRHHAGKDLTTDFQAAPHGTEIFERVSQVGVLKTAQPLERPMPVLLAKLLARYPMLKRHPHPMTVHFPIVFMLSATFFTMLYLMTGIKSLETTGLHCMISGVVMTPVVIITGLFTWWYNYMAKPMRPVLIKVFLSIILFVSCLIAVVWRISTPDILEDFQGESMAYLLIVFALTPMVMVMGWYGAQMTFPVEGE